MSSKVQQVVQWLTETDHPTNMSDAKIKQLLPFDCSTATIGRARTSYWMFKEWCGLVEKTVAKEVTEYKGMPVFDIFNRGDEPLECFYLGDNSDQYAQHLLSEYKLYGMEGE